MIFTNRRLTSAAALGRSLHVVLVLTVALAGCTVNGLTLSDRECPCVQDWMCDEQTNLCVEVGGQDAMAEPDARWTDADATVSDAALSDASLTDAAVADAAVADAAIADASTVDASPIDASVDCIKLVINEIVIWAQQDWDDSAGGDGVAFNAVPGTRTRLSRRTGVRPREHTCLLYLLRTGA